jgi:uncharacterized protein (DUF1697 family)
MRTWIALIRGINVGGRQLPMQALRTLLAELGCNDVRTYIQSGNAVFCSRASDASRLAGRISRAIAADCGFEPFVLVLSREELAKAATANPYAKAAATAPKSVHLFFLETVPKTPDLAAMQKVKAASESFALDGRTLYLHTPDGFGISKLGERAERLLGVPATARNWRTVTTLLEMSASRPSSGRN